MTPLVDLARLAEAYMDATEADCGELPTGHESTCQCEAHREVRNLAADLRSLIATIRNA